MLRWQDARIGLKLSFFTASLLVVIASLGVWASLRIGDIVHDGQEVAAGNQLRAELLQREVEHLNWASNLSLHVHASGNSTLSVELDSTKCGFGKWFHGPERRHAELLLPALKDQLLKIEQPHRLLHESARLAEERRRAGDMQGAKTSFETATLPALEDVRQRFGEMRRLTQAHLLSDEGMLDKARATQRQMLAAVAATGVLGLLLSFLLSRSISVPLVESVAIAVRVSKGDLTVQEASDRKDEIGQLSQALRQMVLNLIAVVDDVRRASTNVAAGSQQLSSSAQHMSEGVTFQASSVEEVASSMEQMVAGIGQNTDNARQTERMASKSADDARTGGKAVSETVEAMKAIAEKTTIIDEIARRTDLLALNAAIEAARAGEHGRGFAVVASEVRKLAERSQDAASKISELSISSVSVSARAGSMLAQVVPDIQKTANLVKEISSASVEQSTGASRINQEIQKLDQVIQQNASAAEELAATSEELSSQAMQLQSAISFFKLSSDPAS